MARSYLNTRDGQIRSRLPYSRVRTTTSVYISRTYRRSVEWLRIILDEAHSCKSRQSKTARAVCTLRARRRWAVTGRFNACLRVILMLICDIGTPIVNRLEDLYSLLYAFVSLHSPTKADGLLQEVPQLHTMVELHVLPLVRPFCLESQHESDDVVP